jgi:HlyD family secretion protein
LLASPKKIVGTPALERLVAPEDLDSFIRVTSPFGWVALAAVVLLLSGIVVWGLAGTVPTRVQGAGILVARGADVHEVTAPASGTLTTVAASGAPVRKGQIIATLDNTQVQQNLADARKALQEQNDQLQQIIARFAGQIAARDKVDAQQRVNLAAIIRSAEERRAFYADALGRETPAVAVGLLTTRFVQDTRQQMETAEQKGREAQNALLQIDADELQMTGQRDDAVWKQQDAINTARRAVKALELRLNRETRILSPIGGHVTDVKAAVGTVVEAGRPVLSIEAAGKTLGLLLFTPAEQGKKVAPGMEARIEPATVKREEYGTLAGRIVEVSEFPISPAGMLAMLDNAQLVQLFSAHGAPYSARVELVADAANPSGYAWSRGAGPPSLLSAGTTAVASVTVKTQAPITLVLPLLRRWLGQGG